MVGRVGRAASQQGNTSTNMKNYEKRPMKKFYCHNESLLGSSGGVVNSLDFCPASLKSLGFFYFWCVLSSQWKVVTVNL